MKGGLLVLMLPLFAFPLAAQSLRTFSAARQRAGERQFNVDVEFAAGTFRINRDATGALYRTRITYNEERYHPVSDYAAGNLVVGLKANSRRGGVDVDSPEKTHQVMELNVSPEVPTSFDLRFGAAQAVLDLGGLNLVRASVKTGASESHVTFSTPTVGRCEHLGFQVGAAEFHAEQLANARCRALEFQGGVGDVTLDYTGDWGGAPESTADITMGMGSLTLVLPRSLGVEVEMTRFLSSFDQSGFEKRGGRFYTANWDSAKVKLHVDIKAALGDVKVDWR